MITFLSSRASCLSEPVSLRLQVLDFGGGAGDVAFIAADLVGQSGSVISFDRSAEAVAKGSQRSMERGLKTVKFVQADDHTIHDTIGDTRFDAIVGRLVLLFQPDPIATLRGLMSYAKPSGIVAFHEYDQEAPCWSQPHLSLLENVYTWIINAFRQGGMVTDAGKIARVFRSARLQSVRIGHY